MDAFYQPKAFDGNTNPDYCVMCQDGESSTEPHWHSGTEIIYMDKGTSNVFFDGRWTVLKEKSMLFIPPKFPHCCRCDDRNATKFVLGFTKNYIGRENCAITLPSGAEKLCIMDNLADTEIPKLICDLTSAANEKGSAAHLTAKADILLICAYIAKHWKNHGIQLNNDEEVEVHATRKFIAEHFTEDISPYDFARSLGISYSFLAKKLRLAGADSFTALLKRARIDESKRRLSTTDENITEIGYDCGFGDTSYFIKTFKAVEGITPKEYKKRCKDVPAR